MEEEVQPPHRPAQSLMAASRHKKATSSSPAIRFLGFFEQPVSDSNSLELEESDVIWSPDLPDSPITDSNYSPRVSNPVSNYGSNHSFRSEKSGLSAALSDDYRPHVQRKSSLNSSLSAAAKMIPLVSNPPRSSGSSLEDYSGSFSGKFHQSAPVNVPVWPKANGSNGSAKSGSFKEKGEEPEDEMLPPHEIVARSHCTTFSVFEGVGRTLKGRDLRRVRNAVFQKTVEICLFPDEG